MRALLLAVAIPLLALTACGPSRIFEQDIPLEASAWKQGNALLYKIDVKDPARAYDLFYHVRYDLDYPYYNLYLKMQVLDSAGAELLADRQELVLLDPQTGKPEGSGIGGVYDKEFTAIQKIHFRETGRYSIKLAQYMRMATLPGLHEVGVRVSESE